jgi:hypothetical protein
MSREYGGIEMKRRSVYLVIAALALIAASVLLTWGQPQEEESATIQDLYQLLTTEDGRNRLDILEEWILDIDEEVDLVHSVAMSMLEEQYGFFAQEEWTSEDLTFQLNRIEELLQDVKDCSCP